MDFPAFLSKHGKQELAIKIHFLEKSIDSALTA
jgi:hypothetical protein